MAIDFQEETRSKRILALKISREAQRELARRLKIKEVEAQKVIEAEEQKKREKAVMQLDDILPDNNNALQKMASIGGILNESLNQGINGGNDPIGGY